MIVLVIIKFLFNGSEVHGSFDNVKIIRNSLSFRVYRLMEDPCLRVFP
jgi:hypothetical protein